MTRKSLTDKLKERRALETGESPPRAAKKKAAATKGAANTPAPKEAAGKTAPSKAAAPSAKGGKRTVAAPVPAKSISLIAPDRRPAFAAAPAGGALTTFAPTGPLARRFPDGRLAAVSLGDGRTALVDRHWGDAADAFVWPADYLFALPFIGMSVCKVVYHRGDNIVYLKGGSAGNRNQLPPVAPDIAVKATVGRLIGFLPEDGE